MHELDRPLSWWTDGDPYTLRDATCGLLCTGQTGAGKTSFALMHLLRSYLSRKGTDKPLGAIINVVKPSDGIEFVTEAVRPIGRGGDVVNWCPGSGLTWDPFEHEKDSETIAASFHVLMGLANRGRSRPGDTDLFWRAKAREEIRAAADVAICAKGRASFQDIFDIIINVPASPDDVRAHMVAREGKKGGKASGEAKENYCMKQIDEAQKQDLTPEQWHNLRMAVDLLVTEMSGMAPETRGSITTNATVVLSTFLHHPLAGMVSGPSTFDPVKAALDGGIVVLNWPAQTGESALLWQAFTTHNALTQLLKRDVRENPRGVVWACDEFQVLITEHLHSFLQRSRSVNLCPVLLTQSITELHAQLGPGSENNVNALLAHLTTKIALCNSDRATNEYYSNLIGRSLEELSGGMIPMAIPGAMGMGGMPGMGAGMMGMFAGPATFGSMSWHQNRDHELKPESFGKLRVPRPGFRAAEAYVIRSGVPFRANGKQYVKVVFPAPEGG